MSYIDWHVGMKVVCVDDEPWPEFKSEMDGLTSGQVYTIRKVGLDPYPGFPGVGVWLDEIHRPLDKGFEQYGEASFSAARFRPVQTRKTDISIFEAMLTGAKTKVPA